MGVVCCREELLDLDGEGNLGQKVNNNFGQLKRKAFYL